MQQDLEPRFIRTSRIVEHCNPLNSCWPGIEPITIEEIRLCLAENDEFLHPEFESFEIVDRTKHIQKIAWFVKNGFSDPIDIDVGVPFLGCWVKHLCQDGNHRLAAAIYRMVQLGEDPILPVDISGSVDYAKELGLWD